MANPNQAPPRPGHPFYGPLRGLIADKLEEAIKHSGASDAGETTIDARVLAAVLSELRRLWLMEDMR